MDPPLDDGAVMAAVAGAAAAVSTLQSMQNVMLGLAADDDVAHGLVFEEEEESEEEKPKQVRRSYPRPDYWGSLWGGWLVRLRELSAAEGGLDPKCREAVQFKGTFRVKCELFELIMQSTASIFPERSEDVAGRDCPPVELKVLGSLKVLASGCCFQDVASCTLMSRTTAEVSFHRFCEKFSEGLWDTWVKLPVGDELKKVEEAYRKCGYPGAVGSLDCTHFAWGCPFSEQNIHRGKEGYTSVVVEAMCDHSGRVIAATKSYPGAENDKTVVQRDKSVWRVRDEEPWRSYKYKLYRTDGTETEHEGACIIVDGGYPKIPLLVPPFKTPLTADEAYWSKRLESIRKDIECLFGRIKGRWRIFKGTILFDRREKIDNAWFTACILHNMLHAMDGLGDLEEDADWVGSAGGLEQAADVHMDVDGDDQPAPGFDAFRGKLATHFRIAWHRREVLWLRRMDV